jgi:hypothetical protein
MDDPTSSLIEAIEELCVNKREFKKGPGANSSSTLVVF